ncbi:unnamed protein product [Vitrella brassicaformis CCMP3155]|uniref:General transcription factor IIH subunit 4 n=3 Tax=Vitrella brassicaformis TaxID=1169539 RepID=A0A0G4G744_VITBC|nr:unnamed protein product [Vitrella brassicaformis CCMP3155]|eukprot:CEM24440.1 unnamed protein product [Vitrella brassicaformis CCMP3155]
MEPSRGVRSPSGLDPGPSTASPAMDHDLFDFLSTLKDPQISKLYRDPAVVQAVFRSLVPLARNLVMRLLYVQATMQEKLVAFWHRDTSEAKAARKEAMLQMKRWRLLQPPRENAAVTAAKQQGKDKQADGEKDRRGEGDKDKKGGGGEAASAAGGGAAKKPDEPGDEVMSLFVLNKTFQETLKTKNISEGLGEEGLMTPLPRLPSARHSPERHQLHEHASKKLQALLAYLVSEDRATDSTRDEPLQMSDRPRTARAPNNMDLINVLQRKRLVVMDGTHDEGGRGVMTGGISQVAFQFMLKDMRKQLASLVGEYLRMVEQEDESGFQLNDSLVVAFTLTQTRIGQPMNVSKLTPPQKRFISFARELGLVWVRKSDLNKVSAYHPTPTALLLKQEGDEVQQLVTALTSAAAEAARQSSSSHHSNEPAGEGANEGLEMGIMVQSNFKVYAYTTSTLQISLLGAFCRLDCQLKNCLIGALTRDSCGQAFRSGITAQQILRYLKTHAHPVLHARHQKEGRSILPDNVEIQLRLWERERKRVKMTPSQVFMGFMNRENRTVENRERCLTWFKRVEKYARDRGCLVWASTPSVPDASVENVPENHDFGDFIAVRAEDGDSVKQRITSLREHIFYGVGHSHGHGHHGHGHHGHGHGHHGHGQAGQSTSAAGGAGRTRKAERPPMEGEQPPDKQARRA